jgi:hypothetical protein
MKILKGKTYFGRHGGQRRKVIALRPFEGWVFFESCGTGIKGECTIGAFEKWMRDPPITRVRNHWSRVCKHCGRRVDIAKMEQFVSPSGSKLWKCKHCQTGPAVTRVRKHAMRRGIKCYELEEVAK